MKHYGDIDGVGLDTVNNTVNELKNFGLIPIRLTEVQRDALTVKPIGLIIDNTTADEIQRWNGSIWKNIDSGPGSIFIFEASSSVPASTPSGTHSHLLGMCITPPAAGEYALWFTSETQATNASTESQYTIFVNGVEVLGSSKSIKLGSNNVKTEVTLLRKINYVSGSIDIRFRKTSGAGVVTSLNRTLMLIC